MRVAALLTAVLAFAPVASAALPEPPKPEAMIPWQIPWGADFGAMSASDLLEKPAGKAGVISVKGDRFVTADGKRIRFWGVNVAFAANFPTHAQADVAAARLAAMGVNCVRFHHMDMFAWPRGGIFADEKLEKLHPEALDRLDYFIAALKKHGIYSNINLHVSRSWTRAHKMPNADKLDLDKMVDLYYPELIEAQQQYARDLLGRVNKYTGIKYADEPAIAMVEINNENSLFFWGGDRKIAEMPEPYGPYLDKLWNEWLVRKYWTREKLQQAWAKGVDPVGKSILKPIEEAGGVFPKTPWRIETHHGAAAKVELLPQDSTMINEPGPWLEVPVAKITDTSWHVQLTQGGIRLEKGRRYTVSFNVRARADAKAVPEISLDASVGQGHEPWNNLGLSKAVKLKPGESRRVVAGFTASADENNARLTFGLGRHAGVTYRLSDISLAPGGIDGLRDTEEFGKSIQRRSPDVSVTQQRSDDWFDFLQQLDESYFVSMREFLKKEVGVKQPITGTIAFGMLSAISQSKMDFVDAHSYWDHPQFPRRGWDAKDWKIHNLPMSDEPQRATLWGLASARTSGKPFTVTEYNHSAPNEWQAECVPMISAFAAAQDWDGVFLFAYSHNDRLETRSMDGFFDLEGNGGKIAQMPLAARVFLAGMDGKDSAMPIGPLEGQSVIRLSREQGISGAARFYHNMWHHTRDIITPTWEQGGRTIRDRMAEARVAVSFEKEGGSLRTVEPGLTKIVWPDEGVGAGRFICTGRGAAVFAGFVPAGGADVGPVRIEKAGAPFITLMAVAKTPGQAPLDGETLLCVVGRTGNTGMKWNEERNSVSNQWGKGPSLVEKVPLTLGIKSAKKPRIVPVSPEGKAMPAVTVERKGERWEATLPGETVWYQVTPE